MFWDVCIGSLSLINSPSIQVGLCVCLNVYQAITVWNFNLKQGQREVSVGSYLPFLFLSDIPFASGLPVGDPVPTMSGVPTCWYTRHLCMKAQSLP
jgi:hypothetical protein